MTLSPDEYLKQGGVLRNGQIPQGAPETPVRGALEVPNNRGSYVLNETTGINEFVPSDTIKRTIIDPSVNQAESIINKSMQPETAAQIAERKRKDAEALIGSINAKYEDELSRKRDIGRERVAMDNAISVLTGLTGSTEAVGSRKKVLDANEKEIAAVNNQRALELAQVYTTISSEAETEAREQLADATRTAEEALARRKETQTKAVENIKLMAAGGLVDFDSFKSSPQNAQVFQYALDSVGGSEDALRALFALNRPQDQIVGTPTRLGDKYVQAYKNPITGKVAFETINLPVDLPPEYSSFQKLGDNLVAIPQGWDGDTSKLVTIAGEPSTMERLQQQSLQLDIAKKQRDISGGGAPDDQLYSGLSSPTATAVRSKVTKFSSEPVIQNFATIQEGHNFAQSIDTKTKNPADDQALIYSLAKALDPGSVVREGEYATAQKYAQSWVAAYGKGIEQALLGTGFLSEGARTNIKKTIEQKFEASKKSYQNLYGQYEKGINSLTGRDDGQRFLTDYTVADDQPSGTIVTAPDGTEVEIID